MFERTISVLRCIALICAMAFIYILIGLNVGPSSTLATILFLSVVVFVVLEICGIIYRCIRAGKAQTEEQQKFIMLFFCTNLPDIYVTDSLRRIAGLGIIALIICAVLGKPVDLLLNSQYAGVSLVQLFAAYLKWSVIVFPIIVLLSILKRWYIMPHLGEGAYSMGMLIWKMIKSDFACLFYSAKRLLSSKEKALPLIKLTVGIALIIFVALGIVNLQ